MIRRSRIEWKAQTFPLKACNYWEANLFAFFVDLNPKGIEIQKKLFVMVDVTSHKLYHLSMFNNVPMFLCFENRR